MADQPECTLNPYLVVSDASAAIDYYQRHFGAKLVLSMPMPDGKMGHAELQLGNSLLMLADEFPDMGFHGPHHYQGSPVSFCLYVEDADAVVEAAVADGAEVQRPVADQFYGDRAGTIKDPFGHTWTIATRKESLTEAQIQQRFAEFLAKQAE
ncbi:VOC family protein [Ferrimonas marina]|uniref:PhnB protein n=1 Tax=Ferrimonas marina TaxID=299255 RepID=A0A1M5N9L8_9GAMM|nr:VOC family protein [Ferrimonas marina]SHG86234.1 PhnB protein [Ferrimonas marina]